VLIVLSSCSDEGRLPETCRRWSRMRRPRAGLVTLHSGGRGHPSAGTMTGCLEWLDAVGLKASGSSPDKRRLCVGPHPEARAREPKSPPVERREAPFPDRKGKGDASQASRAALRQAAQEASQASAFPGAPLPSIFREHARASPGPTQEYGRFRAPARRVIAESESSTRFVIANCKSRM
jgi:hypothetical protein